MSFAKGFGLLALFSLLSDLLGGDESRTFSGPRDDSYLWLDFSRR
jgi:hypothetical protein